MLDWWWFSLATNQRKQQQHGLLDKSLVEPWKRHCGGVACAKALIAASQQIFAFNRASHRRIHKTPVGGERRNAKTILHKAYYTHTNNANISRIILLWRWMCGRKNILSMAYDYELFCFFNDFQWGSLWVSAVGMETTTMMCTRWGEDATSVAFSYITQCSFCWHKYMG